MNTISQYVSYIADQSPLKIVISKPASKGEAFLKIVIDRKENYYQLAKYTDKQVFHENMDLSQLSSRCAKLLGNTYLQLNAWTTDRNFP